MMRSPTTNVFLSASMLAVAVALFVWSPAGRAGAASAAQTASAAKEFPPPRVAVVDTFEIIEKYQKKADLEALLKGDVDKATQEVEAMEREAKTVEAELKIVEENTDEHRRLFLRKTELGLKLNELKVKIRRELEEKQMNAIQQIRKEVELEIENYYQAHRLDLVIEKKIPIEGRGATQINIPIIRFNRPEIEITDEIAQILNDRYRKNSATGSK